MGKVGQKMGLYCFHTHGKRLQRKKEKVKERKEICLEKNNIHTKEIEWWKKF